MLIGSPIALYRINQARRAEGVERLQAERYLYVADVNLAQQALQAENLGRATDLLRKHLPRRAENDLRGFEWRYLWQLCRSDGTTLGQHSNMVTSVSFSTDGKLLASVSIDETLKIWEVESKHPLMQFDGSPNAVPGWDNSVHFLPDGKTLVNGVGDRVRRIDTTTFKEWHFLPEARGHISVSQQGLLATGAAKGVKLWKTETWECVGALEGVSGYFFTLSPNGSLLAERAGENVVLWDVALRRRIKPIKVAPPVTFPFVIFSPDGQSVAVHAANNTIELWNINQDRDPVVLRGHRNFIVSAAFSPDARTLASFSADHNVKLWDVFTGTNFATLKGHQSEICGGSFCPDGHRLATGGKDFSVKLWDARPVASDSSEMIRTVPLWMSPDCKTMLVCSTNAELQRLRAQELHQLSSWALNPKGRIDFNGISPDGHVVAVGMPGDVIDVLASDTGRRVASVRGHSRSAVASYAAFSRSGRLLATMETNSTVDVWELPNGNLKASLPRTVWPLAISPDERVLAGTTGRSQSDPTFGIRPSGVAKLWDIATQRELATSQGEHFDDIAHLAFSPDGQLLATASDDNTVKLWQVLSGKLIATLSGHKMGVRWVSMTPDGRTLASASDDGTVKLWNLATYQEVLTLPGRTLGFGAEWVQFSEDGSTLAFASTEDRGIVNSKQMLGRLWHAPSLGEIAETEANRRP